MKTIFATRAAGEHNQFSLLELFEYITICSILSALSGVFGLWASLFLMLMTLAIWLRAGQVAMGMLLAVLLVAHTPRSPLDNSIGYGESVVAAFVALGIALWYGLRRRRNAR